MKIIKFEPNQEIEDVRIVNSFKPDDILDKLGLRSLPLLCGLLPENKKPDVKIKYAMGLPNTIIATIWSDDDVPLNVKIKEAHCGDIAINGIIPIQKVLEKKHLFKYECIIDYYEQGAI